MSKFIGGVVQDLQDCYKNALKVAPTAAGGAHWLPLRFVVED